MQSPVQVLVGLHFLLPSFQFMGYSFLNFKIILTSTLVIAFFMFRVVYQRVPFFRSNFSLLITVIAILVMHLLSAVYHGGDISGNFYLYLKLVISILLFMLVSNLRGEKVNPQLWVLLLTLNVIVAFLQQFPWTRDVFMPLYGSVQGHISLFPYSRASGITSSFYVYTQVVVLMYLIARLGDSEFKSRGLLLGGIFNNTRTTILLPFYYIFCQLNTVGRMILVSVAILAFAYAVTYFAPLKAVFKHIILVYEDGSITPLLQSQNPSVYQRIEDIIRFTELWGQSFYSLMFTGLGASHADGQEVGLFYIATKVGVLLTLFYYLMPCILVFSKVSSRDGFTFLLMAIPLLIVDLAITGLAKFDLYILYWLYAGFFVRNKLRVAQ